MALSPAKKLQAEMASKAKHPGKSSPEYLHARTEWNALRIAEYVAKCVADAPPLSESQRRTIIAVIKSGGTA